MKCSSDSLLPFIPMKSSTPKDEMSCAMDLGYSKEFQAMLDGLDEEDAIEDQINLAMGKKKRRLSLNQVKALEKHFEEDNKLDPERKVKLALELGLQQRQVAIWFQNRRARWKTKQLEKEFGILQSSYEALKLEYEMVEREKEALNAELRDLKMKLGGESCSVKEDILFSESENNNVSEQRNSTSGDSESNNLRSELGYNNVDIVLKDCNQFQTRVSGASSSSPSSMLIDCSASQWFQFSEKLDSNVYADGLCGVFAAAGDEYPASATWFNFEQSDYHRVE